MASKKKIVRHVETRGANGCVDFYPSVLKRKSKCWEDYDCVNGVWNQKTGTKGCCKSDSKFASDQYSQGYVCYPPSGRFRQIPSAGEYDQRPVAPRKPRSKAPKAAPSGAKKSGLWQTLVSQEIKGVPEVFVAKERFARGVQAAKVKLDEIKAAEAPSSWF